MLKINYNYSGKNFILTPYTTAQEKDLLLLSTVGESDINIALDICGIQPELILSLTADEKIAMMYKLREISVGAEVNLKFTCSHCGQLNENTINIENIIHSGSNTNELITDKFIQLTEDNLSEFIQGDVENMDLDEYDAVIRDVQTSITRFEFMKPTNCQKCSKEQLIKIDEPGLVLELMSDDSLIGMYQTYNDLNFFGSYTKLDIDSLYPFERTILVSLLNKSREGMNNER